jgi:hypothetical protein
MPSEESQASHYRESGGKSASSAVNLAPTSSSQDVDWIRRDVDLDLIESLEQRGFQTHEELPVRSRVGHIDEETNEVLLIALPS